MTASSSDLKKKPGSLDETSPALLMTFTQAAEEVCVSSEGPDWAKAAGDAGQMFLELLRKHRANDEE